MVHPPAPSEARPPAQHARGTILLLCMGLVVVLWCGIALQLTLDYDTTIAATKAQNENLGRLFAGYVRKTIRAADLALGEIVEAYHRGGASLDLRSYAVERKLYQDPNTALAITDSTGKEVLGSFQPPWGLSFADTENFNYHMANQGSELFVSAPRQGQRSGRSTVYLSHRIATEEGGFAGIALYGLDPSFLSWLAGEMELGPKSLLSLVGYDGVVRARVIDGAVSLGGTLERAPGFRAFLDQDRDFDVGTSAFDGVMRVASFHHVGDYPLVFVLATSLDHALSGYFVRRSIYLAGGGAITLVIGLFGSLAAILVARTEHANQALGRSEAHLNRAQRLGAIGSFERYFADDRMIWSEESFRIFGLDPVRTVPSWDILVDSCHPADRDKLEKLRGHTHEEAAAALEHRIIRPDGAVRTLRRMVEPLRDASGTIIGRVGTLQDITEQKQAEMSLELLHSASLAIAEATDFDDALKIVIRTVCLTTNWAYADAWIPTPSGDALMRAAFYVSVHDPRLEALANRASLRPASRPLGHIVRAWQTRRPIWVPDLVAAQSDNYRTAAAMAAGIVSTFALPILSGEEVVAVLRFATQERRECDAQLTHSIAAVAVQLGTALGRKQAEQALRQSEHQLRHGQKMQAIGTLTGGLAHDLNNLLGIILGNLELLRETARFSEDESELVEQALHGVTRGSDLVRSLLAFARRQPLAPKRVEINALVTSVTRMLDRLIGERIRVRLDLATDLLRVTIDPAQLETAITNLATNARDAMPEGGSLTISTGAVRVAPAALPGAQQVPPGDYVFVDVADTGIGMDAELIDRIFEPFFTTKEEGKGSGLGLSMVFGFMQQSGGHVTVSSAPGRGSVFRLYLPAEPAAVLSGLADGSQPGSLSRGKESILVVEDTAMMRSVAVKQIASLGYRVLAAAGAEEAMALLHSAEVIDLLFTDIVMPGPMDGTELAREAARHRPGLKVLFTSGFPDAHGQASPQEHALLSKPYRKDQLAKALREAFAS